MQQIQSYTAPGSIPGTSRTASCEILKDAWAVFRDLREARIAYGLSPQVFTTLQALLSVLKPNGGLTAFVSNRELSRRTNGLDPRTLRRHISSLAAAGIVTRRSSPNGKRFRVTDPETGEQIGYGIDLAPFFQRALEFSQQAEAVQHETQKVKFLKARLRDLAWELEVDGIELEFVREARLIHRRKIGSEYLQALLDDAPCPARPRDSQKATSPCSSTTKTTASDTHSVRHDQKSTPKEEKDSDGIELQPQVQDTPSDHRTEATGLCQENETEEIRHVCAACPTALSFAEEAPRRWSEIERLATFLGPMIGIDTRTIAEACQRIGRASTAKTILALIEMQDRIRAIPAYFRSLTTGQRSKGFSADRLIKRLARGRDRLR